MAVHGLEPFTADGLQRLRRGAVVQTGGWYQWLVADAAVEGVPVEGADAAILDLEAPLAVAGPLLYDVYDVRAVGPAEVGEARGDLRYLREGGPIRFV